MSELVHHPVGTFAYLPASGTFSNGLLVADGYRLTEWELADWLPMRTAFLRIGEELRSRGLTWTALAGVDLRSPMPFTPDRFADFNASYAATLHEFCPLNDGASSPYTRTNVAPTESALTEPCVRAVQIIEPYAGAGGDFVLSGAAEVTKSLRPEDTIAAGDTSREGMRAKVDFVVNLLAERLTQLGVSINDVTTVDAYTTRPLDWLESVIGTTFVAVQRSGLHRWLASPPVTGLEFEMGCKRVSLRETLTTSAS